MSYTVVGPQGHAVTSTIISAPQPPQPNKIQSNSRSRFERKSFRLGCWVTLLLALTTGLLSSLPANAQLTIWSTTALPSEVDSNDGGAVELGFKFKADTNGVITGLRFYKAKANKGTHVAHLWSNTGALLATATFSGETASGWQQVNFAAPVAISANTIYVASYFAPSGRYSDNTNYFTKVGIDKPPLHALANGTSGFNGVYLYSSKGGYPINGYESTNYWVDVVYTAAQTSSTTPQLSESASTLSFGSITVNSTGTQSLTLSSTGTGPVTVNSASVSGTGFSMVAGTFPVTLNPSQSVTLQAQFKPTVAGAATGQFAISSNSSTNGSAVVSLNGTGTAGNPQLTLGVTSLNFGSVAVSASATQSVTLTSTGTSALTLNSATASGTGYTTVGGSFPLTLNPNQSVTQQVKFAPTSAGTDTGTLVISSNSTGGAASVSLAGTGTSTAHEVDLTWNAPTSSPDPVAGYHIYRSTGSGTAQLINSSIETQPAYADSTVVSGTAYNYTVKSVDSSGVESVASNQYTVTIPTP